MSKTKNKSENKTEKALAAEKEQFGKQQLNSITKTLTSNEKPAKERYVRHILMGTHKEKGAATFWTYTLNLPLSSNSMVSWKFCYMVHKLLRDGHPNAVRDSNRYCRNVKDMGILWGNLHDRYGHIVALSAKFLCLKMGFHVKYKTIPGNLEASDETLEKESGSDVNKVLDMTQELMDYLDAGLKMSETVLRQMDANGAKSTTPAGQCRLAPLIPLILDCSFLYHFSVRLLFKLHSRVAPDALLGHRERFRDLFNSLTQFFDRAREIEYFKSRIQIPDLPDAPPNFLRAAALAEYKKPVIVVPNEEHHDEEEQEQQPEREAPQYYMLSQMGDQDAGMELRETETEGLRRELEALKPEMHLLRSEAQRCVTELKSQVNRLEAELEDQRTHKQMALVDNEHLRMEVSALRSATVANAGAQIGYKEADVRAQAAELRFSQLKERHAELVTGHAELMKKNTETVKLLNTTLQSQDDVLRAKEQLASEVDLLRQGTRIKTDQQHQEIDRLNKELMEQRAELAHMHNALGSKDMEGSQLSNTLAGLQAEREVLLRSARERDAELSSLRQQVQHQQGSLDMERDRNNRELEALRAQLQQQLAINAEQNLEIERLRRELDQTRMELNHANSALQSREMSGSQLSSTVAGLQAEKDSLLRSVREQEAELSSLRQQTQHQMSTLDQERQRSNRELGSLQAQLQQQACREGELTQKLQEEQFCLLQCAVVEAEGIILDAVSKIDDPIHVRCTSSPDYLINRAEITLGAIDKMQQSQMVYLGNRNDASGLLRAVTQFSHLAADTIVNGAATSHSAPTDHADRLTDGCRDCANNCLQFLKDLKLQATLQRADPSATRYTVQRLFTLAQELLPKGQDVRKEELGDMVDKEMVATATAIEEAVLRMDAIMNQARRETSGVKLEVNQGILGTCSDLMKAVHMLVTASTDLQKDIVEGGRGAASVQEFYAKNSCWTEGLISASKAVAWGATQMVDSADRVVTDNGKYEELIACSHEIAASTAQLVASSKVKSDRGNRKLHTLQQASRHVNDMAAVVVSNTKHGQQQITNKDPADFFGLSPIKLKKEEMETQVKVLELENQLEQARVHLGLLRKRHYEIGSSETGPETDVTEKDGAESFPPPPPPSVLASTVVPQSYAQTQPYLNTDGLKSSNPFLQPQTPSFSQSQPYAPAQAYSQAQSHTPSQSYTMAQTTTPSPSYTMAQTTTPPPSSYTSSSQAFTPSRSATPSPSYTSPQAYTSSQTYTPAQSYTPTQSYTMAQSTTPSQSYTSSQAYAPSQSYTSSSSQAYTPSSQAYTSSQSYTPPQSNASSQAYTSQSYTPSQSYAPSQSHLQSQPFSHTQPYTTFSLNLSHTPSPTSSSHASNLSPSQPPSQPPKSPTPSTRKPNIFAKSGNLFKNAFRRGETGTGES